MTLWNPRSEPELIPYQATTLLDARSILVVAPHPDDEVLGCGGLLALAHIQSVPSRVLVLTDGGAGGDAATRERESNAAARVLQPHARPAAIEFWRLPDRGLVPDDALIARLGEVVRSMQAGWLLAPSPFEVHPDHRAACVLAIDAARQRQAAGDPVQLVFFEVGHPLMPNCLIDITPVADLKHRAMQCFGSQLSAQAYDAQMASLNRYRSYTLGPRATHAEAYWIVPPDVLAGGIDAVLADVNKRLRQRF